MTASLFKILLSFFIISLFSFNSGFSQSKSEKSEENTIQVQNPWSNGVAPASQIIVPKFFGYPVTERMPLLMDTGDPPQDRLIYNLRLQHWFYLFNHEKYEERFGAFPELPAGKTAEYYRANPPQVPDEYEEMMFGTSAE